MQVASLVRHKEIASLGVGLVTEDLGVHCKVLWSNESGLPPTFGPGPTLEANSQLEVASERR